MRILELLADGKPRRSDRIATELSERYGFSAKTVTAGLSCFAFDRRIARTKDGVFYEYRRTDVEQVA
jgi:hypothetical protein